MTDTVESTPTTAPSSSFAVEGNEFLEFLDYLKEPELLTKSELLDHVRREGLRVSERQLVTYITEGIIPKSVRVGARAGVFPAAVAMMLEWVVRTRDRGVTVEGVKELVPLWKYAARANRRHEFDFGEFELMARATLSLPDAMYAAPSVIYSTLYCPHCLDGMKFTLKDGSVVEHTSEHPVSMGFQIADIDHNAEPEKVYRWDVGRMTLPVKMNTDDTNLIVMGVPVDYAMPPRDEPEGC